MSVQAGTLRGRDALDHLPHFFIQHLSRSLTERLLPFFGRFATTIADWTDDIVHTIIGNGLKSQCCNLSKIILCTCGNVLDAKEYLFRDTAAEGHTHAVE